jgi:hypothetical protein
VKCAFRHRDASRCVVEAEFDSVFCPAHRAPLPPATRHIVDSIRAPVLAVVGMLLVGLALGVVYPVSRWLNAGSVQTSALGRCPLDVKFEQLHVIVTRRGDELAIECMYIGTRGTYGARRK